MVLDNIHWLDQIQPSHRGLVGDKAFYLGLLMQRAYPVVPGFVISTTQLQDFLTCVDWQGQMFADLPNTFLYVDTNNPWQLQTVAQQIQRAILATPLPETLFSDLQSAVQQWQGSAVIFRPSFAFQPGIDPTISSKIVGLLDSQVCLAEPESLAAGLKRMWAELFQARSLFFWHRLGIQLRHVQLAVLVQPIRSVDAAGELQIADRQMKVWATWGLGHALVRGDCVGDRYEFGLRSGLQSYSVGKKVYAYHLADRSAQSGVTTLPQVGNLQLDLVDANQQEQPVLTLDQLQQLASLAQQVQTELGMSLTLEWVADFAVEATTASFQFTQVIPHFRVSHRTPRFYSQSTAGSEKPSRSHLTGLAAAPGRAIAPAWVLHSKNINSAEITDDVILIAPFITPDQIIRLKLAGIVTERGGMTSHAAILARELGIPAVVGVDQATQMLQTGDRVAVDGDRGEVHYGAQVERLEWQPKNVDEIRPDLVLVSKPTTQPQKIQLFATLSQLDRLANVAALPVDGVGLLRSELMLLDLFEQQHPEVWLSQRSPAEATRQIASRIQEFAAAFAPRPVFYRTLDLRSHEFTAASSTSNLYSPLGVRGTFSYQRNPDLFQVQLAALKQVQQRYSNICLLLPFVRTVEEFSFCRQFVEQAGLFQQSDFQIWIMAEVPSVLFLLEDYAAAGVQGIAIGTNDLTQLMLGVDRDHPQMATAFDPYHPAVLRAVEHLIKVAQKTGIACSICGQSFKQHPDLFYSLLQMGITAVSVDPGEIEFVSQLIQRSVL